VGSNAIFKVLAGEAFFIILCGCMVVFNEGISVLKEGMIG